MLLIPFPIILIVFILQIALEIRMKGKKETDNEGTTLTASERPNPRLLVAAINYWPIFATGYTWAIFLALMLQYEKGFESLFHATLGTVVTVLILLLPLKVIDWAFRRLFRIKDILYPAS